MNQLIAVLTLALALVSCVSVSQLHTSTGRLGASISCRTWAFGSITDCYRAASDLCGSAGYVILSNHATDGWTSGGSNHYDQILIECK